MATSAPTPGSTTSEFKLTKIVVYAGIATQVLGGLITVLTVVQGLAPHLAWVGVVLVVAGKIATVLKSISYDETRQAIKVAAIGVAADTVAKNPASIAAANLGKVP
jgi:hypothetical protein